MINFDDVTKESKKEYNPNWLLIPDHPYRILIVGYSGSGKTNTLLNVIIHQPDVDKIFLYAKDPYKPKYQLLINKREKVGLKYLKDIKTFIEYLSDMQNVFKSIEEYNLGKKRKVKIVFGDMIADKISNKKRHPVVTELFTRCKEVNIFLVFITQTYFPVPKDIRVNTTHFLITKISNRQELQ